MTMAIARIKPRQAAQQRTETIEAAYGGDFRSALAGVVDMVRRVEEKSGSLDIVEQAAVLEDLRMAKSLLTYVSEQYLKAAPEVESYLKLRETIGQKTRSLDHYRAKWASRADGDPEKKKLATKVRDKEADLRVLTAQLEAAEAGQRIA
ncbi:MAG: hypothetical protein IJS96_03015 [Schwartzia sp.]|nr:hypothetical protein [Schwartzia sp. (in: firmicutes)]